jgi:23S rRNA (adenine2503-C2)-methyltransferase
MLLDACRRYPEWITFEYVLLGGVNDSPEDARRVARLLAGMQAKINLIPWNAGALPYRPPDPERMEEFRQILVARGLPAFVRYSRGRDVSAACGQLASMEISAAAPPSPA